MLIQLWIMWISLLKINAKFKKVRNVHKCKRVHSHSIYTVRNKNPHSRMDNNQHLYVDNVDNLPAKYEVTDIRNISGAHSYQQVMVHTIF